MNEKLDLFIKVDYGTDNTNRLILNPALVLKLLWFDKMLSEIIANPFRETRVKP